MSKCACANCENFGGAGCKTCFGAICSECAVDCDSYMLCPKCYLDEGGNMGVVACCCLGMGYSRPGFPPSSKVVEPVPEPETKPVPNPN